MSERGSAITTDRRYDSGGRIIGEKLSEELGIPFYDQEIFRIAPEESAVGEQFLHPNDGKAGNNLICRVIGGLKSSPQEPSVEEGITSPENLFRFQAEVIRKIVGESPCIIVGRYASYVLDAEAKEQPIRLLAYADILTCIRRAIEVDDVDAREALKRVNRINKERRGYCRYYTRKDWEDMANYDLPINTIRLELDGVVTLIKDCIRVRGYEL